MVNEIRQPEGRAVETETIGVFSRVAGWTGLGAAWRVRGILGEPIRKGEKVLDVGTGPGTIPLHLQRFFPAANLIGLDISPEMLGEARQHSKRMKTDIGLVAAEGEGLPFADQSLDMVISFFAIHHMDQPLSLLTEIDRVLKPEGRLLILDFRRDMPAAIFHAINGFWQVFFCFSSGRNGFKESVQSAWQPAEIEQLLAANNLDRFKVVSTRTEMLIVSNIRRLL